MYDSGEALRGPAKGDNGGQTFVYMRPPDSDITPVPFAYTPSTRSLPTTGTQAHEDAVQYASGSPSNIRHLLCRPEEEIPLVSPDASAREPLENQGGAQEIGPSDKSPTEPESTTDKADMELLKTARRLRVEGELATEELSTSESEMQQAQSKCLALERQANEQRSKEVELVANLQRLREEIMKGESEAAECRKSAELLDKEADDERFTCKERETSIVSTKERVTEIEKKLQNIRDELKI
ncbi:hypothetical protein Q7P37_010331 [Cladosporium fusiforme]